MKKAAGRLALVFLFAALAATTALAQSQGSGKKTLQGKVLGDNNVALSGAIVYLENMQTRAIRSFFSTGTGAYRFGQISPDNDFHVWAQYKGKKSSTHTISSYDSRTQIYIDLHIKTPQ